MDIRADDRALVVTDPRNDVRAPSARGLDHGFMHGHGFQDLDGYIVELIYMDPSAIKQG